MRDFTLGRYHAGDSLLHRLDPRTKLVCTLVLMLAVFATSSVAAISLLLALLLALYPLGRLPLRLFWSNVKVFAWLYIITFFIHLFFHPGTEIARLPLLGWAITGEGLEAGVLFTLRIVLLVSLSSLLLALTMPQDLTDGLERLLKPAARLGLPVSEGALMISIALRFVPILWDEAEKIRRAQVSRGADLDGGLIARMKKSLPMLIPLFAGALKRADDLALALEARAYQGGRGRTRMIALKYSPADGAAFALTLVLAAGLGLLRGT